MEIDDRVVACDASGRIERVKKEGCKRGGEKKEENGSKRPI